MVGISRSHSRSSSSSWWMRRDICALLILCVMLGCTVWYQQHNLFVIIESSNTGDHHHHQQQQTKKGIKYKDIKQLKKHLQLKNNLILTDTNNYHVKDKKEDLPTTEEKTKPVETETETETETKPVETKTKTETKPTTKTEAEKASSKDTTTITTETAAEVKEEVERKEEEKSEDKKKMNILLLYADDWTHDTLGIAGNAVVKTPVLNQLAKDGIHFRQNCVTTSICWCSRATLFTGLYTARHKTTLPQEWFFGWKKALYQLMKDGGYSVAHSGKIGIWADYTDLKLDFMTNEDGWHQRQIGDKLWHVTEKNEADSIRYLRERDTSKPFFLNTAFFATHAVDGDKRQYLPMESSMSMYNDTVIPKPKTATDEAWKAMPPFFDDQNEGRTRWKWRFDTPEKFQSMMKNYYRMASEVDTASGNIIEEIKRQGEWDNTIVIFTTDNGNFHAQHGLADKWYPHQESLRVPLIIRDPRMSADKVGTTNDEFTLNLDLAPTILKAAGLPIPDHMMGRDMSQLYLDNNTNDSTTTPWRSEFFYEHPASFAKTFIPASEALVRKDYKYFYWPQYDYEELFHIPTDPYEEHDLLHNHNTNTTTTNHTAILEEMRIRFKELKDLVHSNETITL